MGTGPKAAKAAARLACHALIASVISPVSKINGEVGVNWLFSFLSADKRKSYCLYEAKDPESIREAARRANLPADVIVEVSQQRPELILAAAGR